MAVFVPRNWKDLPDLSTPIDAANLNRIEAGIVAAAVSGAIVNADIGAGAAIAYSKLNLALGILNADISASAAIGIAKLAGYPTDATKFLRGDGTWAAPTSGAELVYVESASGVTVSSATEATPTDVLSAGAFTFDGSAVIFEFSAPYVQTYAGASANVTLMLFEGTTNLGRIAFFQTPAASAMYVPVFGRRRFTPSAGSHTYKVAGYQSGGNGIVGAGAGGTAAYMPMAIRITKA